MGTAETEHRKRLSRRGLCLAIVASVLYAASGFGSMRVHLPSWIAGEVPMQIWLGRGAFVIEPVTSWTDSDSTHAGIVSWGFPDALFPIHGHNTIRYGGPMRRAQNALGISVMLWPPVVYLWVRLVFPVTRKGTAASPGDWLRQEVV